MEIIYGAFCYCHGLVYTFGNFNVLQQQLKGHKMINKKGEKSDILNWLNYCKSIFYNENFIEKDKMIFSDSGLKNGILDIRVTDFYSNSLLKEILCDNLITVGNLSICSSQFSVNFGELLGIYLALKIHSKFKTKSNFILTDSSVCIFYWLYGNINLSVNPLTCSLIQEVRRLIKINNIKIYYINRKYNKADIDIGNKKEEENRKNE